MVDEIYYSVFCFHGNFIFKLEKILQDIVFVVGQFSAQSACDLLKHVCIRKMNKSAIKLIYGIFPL